MRAIQYAAPQSLEEAILILQEIGPKARILAGGTDLIVQVGADARDVNVIVDGKHIPELMELALDPERGLTLGAAVPCYRIYEDPAIRRALSRPGRCRLDHRRNRHSGPGFRRRQSLQLRPRRRQHPQFSSPTARQPVSPGRMANGKSRSNTSAPRRAAMSCNRANCWSRSISLRPHHAPARAIIRFISAQ